MKWILLITLIVKSQNSVESSIANADNGGTVEFIDQVKNSNGEWVENAGSPVFDNQVVASLSPKPLIFVFDNSPSRMSNTTSAFFASFSL